MKVTVLLPTFNSSEFIIETINSICEQDFMSFELIIIDDASTDDTLQKLNGYLNEKQINYKVVEKPYQKGVCDSLIQGSMLAQGEYIAQIGHDDVWAEMHLSNLVSILDEKPNSVAAFAKVSYIDANSAPMNADIFKHEKVSELSQYELFSALLTGNFLCAPSSLIRVSALKPFYWGYRNERLQDYLVWMFLILKGDFTYSTLATVKYRLHSNNLSSGGVMVAQSKYEFYSCYSFIFQSIEFIEYYSKVSEDFSNVERLIVAINDIGGYYQGIYLAVASALEKHLVEKPELENQIVPLWECMINNLGLYRKKHSVRKLLPSHLYFSSPQLVVVPVNKESEYYKKYIEFLTCTGFFTDGTHSPLNDTSPFYYICLKAEVSSLMQYNAFRNSFLAKRIFIIDADDMNCESVDGVIHLPEDFRSLTDMDVYRMVSNMEDNFVSISPVIGGQGLTLNEKEITVKDMLNLLKLKVNRFLNAKLAEFKARLSF